MSYLGRFGFDEDMAGQKVMSLSGGEQSRLFLAQLLHEKPNLLILDEPTNHLDISMIKSLEKALVNYEGTLILVSHDRYFIQAVTNDYWIIKDRQITAVTDSFENVLAELKPYEKEKKVKIGQPQGIAPTDKPKKLNSYQINKLLEQIDDLDAKINAIELEKQAIQSKFSDSEFYSKQENIHNANQQIKALEKEIEDLNKKKHDLENEYLEITCE
jgi:ATP-binding cassette subfamily F protein 3